MVGQTCKVGTISAIDDKTYSQFIACECGETHIVTWSGCARGGKVGDHVRVRRFVNFRTREWQADLLPDQ